MSFFQVVEDVGASRGITVFQMTPKNLTGSGMQIYIRATVHEIRQVSSFQVNN